MLLPLDFLPSTATLSTCRALLKYHIVCQSDVLTANMQIHTHA